MAEVELGPFGPRHLAEDGVAGVHRFNLRAGDGGAEGIECVVERGGGGEDAGFGCLADPEAGGDAFAEDAVFHQAGCDFDEPGSLDRAAVDGAVDGGREVGKELGEWPIAEGFDMEGGGEHLGVGDDGVEGGEVEGAAALDFFWIDGHGG